MVEEALQVGWFLWWTLFILILGLFIGGNAGVMLMCIFQMALHKKICAEEELGWPGEQDTEAGCQVPSG